MKRPSALLGAALFTSLAASVAWAQTVTSSATPGIDDVLAQGVQTYEAFKVGSILVGLSFLVNLLVNLTRLGPVGEYIEKNNIRWVRLVLALVAGVLGGVVTAAASGKPIGTAVLYGFTGIFTGSGAVMLHELYSMVKTKGTA